jgi:hypothetical protein
LLAAAEEERRFLGRPGIRMMILLTLDR